MKKITDLKAKILHQKKLDYINGEIANYQEMVKSGSDWTKQFSVKKLEEFNKKLKSL